MTRSRFVICLECCYTHRAGNLELFARLRRPGRAPGTAPARDRVRGRVIALRRQGLSSYEISARLPAEGTPLNRTSVAEILTEEGFGRTTIASLFQAAAFAFGGFALFLITYRLLTPGKGLRLRDHLPGAAAFTIVWLALTALGELVFTRLIQNSTALYGTIGGIFGLLTYLYATMWSLLIGAELSAVLVEPDPS